MKNENITITILGCGSSGGVPTIENGWGNCNPNNNKNYRSRASILVSINNFNILIDTSPDLRTQALKNNIKKVDCILYTHEHSDHVAGLDDIRSFNRLSEKAINCYLNQKTFSRLQSFFNYIFINTENNAKLIKFYRPALIPHIINNGEIIKLNSNKVIINALEHSHGNTNTIGYKFNNSFAYITDILNFSNQETLDSYKNLDLLIISACVLKEHKSHMTLEKVVKLIINELKPKRAYLTHMAEGIDFDKESANLKNNNINNIYLCYDGLKIEL